MIQTVTIEIPDYVIEDVVDERIEEGLWMIERMLRSQLLAPEIEVVKGECVIIASPMSDTNTTPAPDDSGKREQIKAQLKQAGEELKAELATVIDQKLDEVGAQIGG